MQRLKDSLVEQSLFSLSPYKSADKFYFAINYLRTYVKNQLVARTLFIPHLNLVGFCTATSQRFHQYVGLVPAG